MSKLQENGMRLSELENPWISFDASDYERHMSHASLRQLQTLNEMTRCQYQSYRPCVVLFLGVCTGNGLEYIDNAVTKKVIGIDINQKFLDICASRYASMIEHLVLKRMDLNRSCFCDEKVDLVIGNLILEFVDLDRYFLQLDAVDNGRTVFSLIYQKNNNAGPVSRSGVESIQIFNRFHQDIGDMDMESEIERRGYEIMRRGSQALPDGKEFMRVDFRKGV